jgi:hypothetical protein
VGGYNEVVVMSGADNDLSFNEADKEMADRWERQDKERASQQGKAVKRVADKYIAQDGGPPKEEAPAGAADGADDPDDDAGSIREGDGKHPKQADILIGLAKAATLFHTPAPDSDAFADIKVGGHRETHRVRGRKFREWLRYQYFEKMESGCNAEAMQVAVETIAAKAQYQGDERQVYVRVAVHEGAIYIDLGDEEWKAVEVTKSRWRSLTSLRCALRGRPARRRCRCRRQAAPSSCSAPSAIS